MGQDVTPPVASPTMGHMGWVWMSHPQLHLLPWVTWDGIGCRTPSCISYHGSHGMGLDVVPPAASPTMGHMGWDWMSYSQLHLLPWVTWDGIGCRIPSCISYHGSHGMRLDVVPPADHGSLRIGCCTPSCICYHGSLGMGWDRTSHPPYHAWVTRDGMGLDITCTPSCIGH